MDPKQFAIDYTQTAEVMAVLVLLALFVERSLTLLFESKWYRERYLDLGIRPLIALAWSCVVIGFYKFDYLRSNNNNSIRIRGLAQTMQLFNY